MKLENERTQLVNKDYELQERPGKGWNVRLRLYSPLQSLFDKAWRPGEFELIK